MNDKLEDNLNHGTPYEKLMAISAKYNGYGYLASPFNSEADDVKRYRAQRAVHANAMLLMAGVKTFSPIAHSYESSLSHYLQGFSISHEKFMDIDIELLKHAEFCIVLTLSGWDISKGVSQEIEYCRQNEIPLYKLSFDDVCKAYQVFIDTFVR